MMFELIAAAVVAAFVSCLYPIVRGFFRDLGEIGSATPVSHLATARRSVNTNLDSKKHKREQINRPILIRQAFQQIQKRPRQD
jgi:hypothetical protein